MTKDNPTSAAELREQASAFRKEAAELESRIAAIRPAGPGKDRGREREQALATGDLDAVRALDTEHAQLVIQAESLRVRSGRLDGQYKEAHARECAENAPGLYRAFEAKIAAVEAAQAALREAWAEANEAYQQAWQARAVAVRGGGLTVESASAELVQRAARAAAGPTVDRLRVSSISARMMADELGVEPGQKVAS